MPRQNKIVRLIQTLALAVALALAWQLFEAYQLHQDAASLRQEQARLIAPAELAAKIQSPAGAAWTKFVYALTPADFPSVVAQAEKVPTVSLRERLQTDLLTHWAVADAPAALAYAQSVAPQNGHRDTALAAVIQGLALSDPRQAVALAQKLPPGPDRDHLLATIVFRLAQIDPAAALAAAPTTGSRNDINNPISSIFYFWANTDLPSALAQARALPVGDQRSSALQGVTDSWALQDPQAAANYLLTLYDAGDANEVDVRAMLFDVWPVNDPVAALNWASHVPDQYRSLRDNIYVPSLFEHWAEHDAPAALAFALKNPDLSHFNRMIPLGTFVTEALTTWAMQDFAAAKNYVDQMPPGPGRDSASSRIIRAWASWDSAAATTAVLDLPEGSNRTIVIESLSGSWGILDPLDALQWVHDLPAGPDQSAAESAVYMNLSTMYPALAADEIETFSHGDTNERNRSIQFVAQRWLKLDRPAAQAWIKQAPLSDSAKKALLHP